MAGSKASDILNDAESYVREFMMKWLPSTRYFHSLHHTLAVVEKCTLLASFYELSTFDAKALVLSAWFHDLGYYRSSKGHEEISIEIFRQFQHDYEVAEGIQTDVEKLLKATKIDHQPVCLLEQIIRDADLHHLGSRDYPLWAAMLRKELEVCDAQIYTERDWNEKNIEFFKRHQFYTKVAKDSWDEQKRINLESLMRLHS